MFKILTAILSILLAVETAWLLAHRGGSNKRFERTREDTTIALDTTTGRLCETIPTKPPDAMAQDGDVWFNVSLPQCSQSGMWARLRPAGRFKTHDDNGYIAWDSYEGRYCRTVLARLVDGYMNKKGYDLGNEGYKESAAGIAEKSPKIDALKFARLLPLCWK